TDLRQLAQQAAAHHSAGQHRGQLQQVGFGRLMCSVTQSHVRDLVRHDTRQLRLVVNRRQQPGLYERWSAGQRESVYALVVDNLECVGETTGLWIGRELVAYSLHDTFECRVMHNLHLSFYLGGGFTTELDVLLLREK